jgi:hypothetical protein
MVKISYIHTLHSKVYVAYPFDLNQSGSIPCFTPLFFPAFHDDVNTCVMGSLIQKEIPCRRKIQGFELKIKLIVSSSDKSYEFKERK